MPTQQDSAKVTTVIPYPRKQTLADSATAIVKTQRTSLPAQPLHTPSYDSILLGATIFAALLLLVMHLYVKKQNTKTSFLADYFNIRKREEGQVYLRGLSILQHLLSLFVFTSLIYYLLTQNTTFNNEQALLHVIVGLVGFVMVRMLLILLTSYFINNREVAAGHLGIIRFLNKLFGLILAPFLVFALLLPEKAYPIILFTMILVLSAKIMAQLVFVYKLLSTRKFSIFHSFLYLCTLEVLPVIYVVLLVGFLMST